MSHGSKQIDSTIDVVTPENIAFQYQAAGPFRRLPAYLIDFLIRLAVVMFVLCAGAFFSIGGFSVGVNTTPVLIPLFLLSWFVMQWFYGGLCETFMNGKTPGKWVMGIRVLTVDGRPINGLQAVLRNVMRFADLMPMVSLQVLAPLFAAPPLYVLPTFMLGVCVMACNPRFQRLGDLVCGTMVIVEERHWLSGVTQIDDPRVFQLASYLPTEFQVSRTLARALAHYVERRQFFSETRRREVASHLGIPLSRQFSLPVDTSHDLLLCSLYYRTFIADRRDDEKHLKNAVQSPFQQPLESRAMTAEASSP
ncbi:MAG: hypothetical protein CMJ59_09250 [Planctomycetaceae bacterium]|nr:hypothetical protein [Planctomycetaceae bacterium]